MPFITPAATMATFVSLFLAAATPSEEAFAEIPTIHCDTQVAPPAWAVYERQLIDALDRAGIVLYDTYVEDDGTVTYKERNEGGMNSSDDLYEAFRGFSLHTALGGSAEIVKRHRKVWEGITRQFTRYGQIYREFDSNWDWVHHGEGYVSLCPMGMVEPRGPVFRDHSVRFATVAADAAAEPDTQWTYKTINDKVLKMDVFLPDGYESSEKRYPAILFYHGGSWSGGKVSWHHPDCAYWSKRGMIAVSVDYRLKNRDQVKVPLECVKDAKSAVRFLRKNSDELKVDANKVVVSGGSAGGQMAAAVAMIDKPNDQSDDLEISCKPNAAVLFNPYYNCEEELRPPNFVVEGLPPIISFLGSEDPAVSVESLKAFHNDLRKAGNASEFYVGNGGKHGFCIGTKERNRFFYWSLELTDAFLVKHGLLTGENLVVRPEGVSPLQREEFEEYR